MPYTETEQAQGQRAMIQEGIFSRTMEACTGGVILVGLGLALGAGDLEIGLLAAVPFLAQLAHIPAVALLRRFPQRKPLAVWGAVAARMLLFVIAALPFLFVSVRPIHALLPIFIAFAVLATLSGAAWQAWVRELVPRDRLGAYFGKRMMALSTVGLVATLAAGAYVSWAGGGVSAYSVLFVVGGVSGLASALLLLRAPSRVTRALPSPTPFPQCLQEPLRDANYRRLLVFLGAWGFAANLALPFVSVVLLRSLGYSVLVVTLFATVSQLANIAGLRLWAPLTDRFGNKPVLGLAASVFLVAMTVWALTPKTPGPLVLAAAGTLHVLLGFALAGLDVASNNIVLKLAREDEVPSYLASASVVKALAAGVAPLLGGLAAMLLAGRQFRVDLAWTGPTGEGVLTALRFSPHDFLFLASVVFGLYAVHRLLGFHEEGEAPPESVLRAMRRDVPITTSVAGMRTFAHAASYLVEAAYRFERGILPAAIVKREEKPP